MRSSEVETKSTGTGTRPKNTTQGEKSAWASASCLQIPAGDPASPASCSPSHRVLRTRTVSYVWLGLRQLPLGT
eukprot:scaffold653358_cov57-Prasinocladus_malaysianus.AAC.1